MDYRPYGELFYAARSRFKCYKDADIGVKIIDSNKSKYIILKTEMYDFKILIKESEKSSKVAIYNRKKNADLYDAGYIEKYENQLSEANFMIIWH